MNVAPSDRRRRGGQAADEDSLAFAVVRLRINVLEIGGGERIDERLTELLGGGVEFLVDARPLPRGWVCHGERRWHLGGDIEREILAIIEF